MTANISLSWKKRVESLLALALRKATSGSSPGAGVPLTINGGEAVLHINEVTGQDLGSRNGSFAQPFKTTTYALSRLLFLTGGTGNLGQGVLTPAALGLHIFCDTVLSTPLGILYQALHVPQNGYIWFDPNPASSPTSTVVVSGNLTAVAQARSTSVTPAHLLVVTLDQAPTGVLVGDLFIDTTLGCYGYVTAVGLACQVAGANNIELAALLTMPTTVATFPTWPGANYPAIFTPGGADAYQILRQGVMLWGATGRTEQAGRLGGGAGAAQVFIAGSNGGACTFSDAGAFDSTGFTSNVSVCGVRHKAAGGAATLYGQSVSGFNVYFDIGLDVRDYDHDVIGPTATTKIAIQGGNGQVDAATLLSGTLTVNGNDGAGVAEVLFRNGAVNLQLLSGAVCSFGAGHYSNKIGYTTAGVFRIQTLEGSIGSAGPFGFSSIFGSYAGNLFIGDLAFNATVFVSNLSVREQLTNASFGSATFNGNVYGVTVKQTRDAAGQAFNAGLVVNAGSATTMYVAAGYGVEVTLSGVILDGGAASAGSYQFFIDGVASTDVLVRHNLAAGFETDISRSCVFFANTDITVGSHTFAVAFVGAGASAPANATLIKCRQVAVV
jgi:hypothetical protein